MRNVVFSLVVSGLLWLHLMPDVHAQDPESASAIYIIFDASGSMWGQLPDKSHKIVVAKEVVRDFDGADLAMRVYGHRRKGDCTDSELVVPFGPSSEVVPQVEAFMESLNPTGKTPIAYSLRPLHDFGDRSGELILITDGLETCDDDPCALVREWKEKDVKINVHVAGFGIEEKEFILRNKE